MGLCCLNFHWRFWLGPIGCFRVNESVVFFINILSAKRVKNIVLFHNLPIFWNENSVPAQMYKLCIAHANGDSSQQELCAMILGRGILENWVNRQIPATSLVTILVQIMPKVLTHCSLSFSPQSLLCWTIRWSCLVISASSFRLRAPKSKLQTEYLLLIFFFFFEFFLFVF